MPVHVRCRCGNPLQVSDDLAGKKVRCPECREVLTVPPPPPPPVLEEEDVYDHDMNEAISAKPRSSGRGRYAEDSEDFERPRRRKKKKEKVPKRKWDAPLFDKSRTSGNHGTVAGGIIMIAVAVVWLVVGLMFGLLFIYPLILMGAGIIAILKGAFSN